MYIKTLIYFSIITTLTSCSNCIEQPYNPKLAIQNRINEKTHIKLDTSSFIIILDSIHNTEGAFDLDYSWFVKLKFDDSYFDNLKENIRATPNYCAIEHQNSESWNNIDTSKVKGIWTVDSVSLKYYQKPGTYSETIILSIDTVTKTFDLELIHL